MMPAPPNVCPLRPVLFDVLPEELVPPVPDGELPDEELPEESPGAPVDGAVPLASEEEPMLEFEEPKLELEDPKPEPEEPNPPIPELLPIPFPPLGPTPAITEPPAEPAPAKGWPKNPSVCVFAWPNMIGFQSCLPVVGSMYFLRRKRTSFVFTSASALGG